MGGKTARSAMKRAVERAPSRVAPEAAASHTSLCVTHQSLKRQHWNLGRGTWVLAWNLVSEQALSCKFGEGAGASAICARRESPIWDPTNQARQSHQTRKSRLAEPQRQSRARRRGRFHSPSFSPSILSLGSLPLNKFSRPCAVPCVPPLPPRLYLSSAIQPWHPLAPRPIPTSTLPAQDPRLAHTTSKTWPQVPSRVLPRVPPRPHRIRAPLPTH